MIPADGTHYVHFTLPNGQPGAVRVVVAWDNDGSPMITGKWGLERASDAGLGAVSAIRQNIAAAVGAVPGGGWLIYCTDDEDNTWTVPILAWTVHADGTATPLTTDSQGITGDATEGLKGYRIYHPDSVGGDTAPPGA